MAEPSTVPSWIGAVLPFRGPCLFCGGPDARHRELDAIAGRVRAGDGVGDVADDYGHPRWFVDRLAREWHIQEPDPDPTPVNPEPVLYCRACGINRFWDEEDPIDLVPSVSVWPGSRMGVSCPRCGAEGTPATAEGIVDQYSRQWENGVAP